MREYPADNRGTFQVERQARATTPKQSLPVVEAEEQGGWCAWNTL